MTTPPSLGIPPLAGLATYEEAARPGYGVDDNVELMRRYNFVETRLYQISAAFMNPTPEWEVKGALSLHLYLDSEHAQSLRSRVAELRRPPLYLDQCPDAGLETLMDEALRAANTIEMLAGVYRVIRPALAAAYRKHLAETNPLFDYPTCRFMRQSVEEEDQMIQWGAAALDALLLTDGDREVARAWEEHLGGLLELAGGITGQEAVPSDLAVALLRSAVAFVADVDPKRDARSGEIYNFHYRANDVYLDGKADIDERILALMFKRFHEMDVPELMAAIVVQTQGKPWEYYRDMGRQLWDEARHSMMGEVWFARQGIDWSKYPNHVGWCMHLNLDRTALERHVILYYIEQSLMDGKTGKRLEWQIAQSSEDALATYFQDYDWADEVLHAQIGRRWLKPEVGDVKKLIEFAKDIAARPSDSLAARSAGVAQDDWWPAFVLDALGKESTSGAGAANALIPGFKYQKYATGKPDEVGGVAPDMNALASG